MPHPANSAPRPLRVSTALRHFLPLLGLLCALAAPIAHAQLGNGWTSYSPTKRIHLDNEAGLQTFTWSPYKSVGTGTICADYSYDAATDTETFRILDNRSNRSEIRLQNDYSTGSRQFEGYVTFSAPLDDESLMQIFGSTSGATQLMIRGFAANGGELRVSTSKVLASAVHGVEHRVNVIHLQEDVGNKIQIYINGVLKHEFADNEPITNYHKYGCYGTLRTAGATVKWRAVRHFRDGQPPGSTTPPPAPTAPPITFEAETLAATPVGGSHSISFEDTASGGQFPSPNISDPSDPRYPVRRRYVTFGADGNPPPPTGEYIDFTLPNVPAGTYNLALRYKTHPTNRGILRLFVDDMQLGADLNQLETATFKSRDFGVVRFATAGSHVVRLAVVGKSNGSGPWNITADVFTLTPDKTPPVIAPLDDIVVEATGPQGAVVTYSGTATDNKDGPVPVTFTPPSGSTFPLGDNIVVATTTDFAGNIAASSFEVIVVDTTPPVLTLPADLTVEATSPDGAPVTLSASAQDRVDGPLPVGFNPPTGSTFALGTTLVTAVAQDASGNTASGTFNVIVRDTTAPAFESLTASPNRLHAANHKLIPITLTAVVRDAADRAPRTRIVSVASNQSANGHGDGNTSSDWNITGDLTLELRAERSGNADDRIYTITVETTDASGNTRPATVAVVVPHDAS